MRLLVTGGAGFIGPNFVHRALARRDRRLLQLRVRPEASALRVALDATLGALLLLLGVGGTPGVRGVGLDPRGGHRGAAHAAAAAPAGAAAGQIGRAHVCTPVTSVSRMLISAGKKKLEE